MEYVNNSLQKHLGQPVDLSRYSEDVGSPKTKAPTSTSPMETVQNKQANNKTQEIQTISQPTSLDNQVESKPLSLLQKIWRLFRKQ